jgi:hypothetical protein
MKDRTDIQSVNTDHTRHPAALVELNECIRAEIIRRNQNLECRGNELTADFAYKVMEAVALTLAFWLLEAEERETEEKEKTDLISNIRERLEELQSDAEAASSSSGDALNYADDASHKAGDLLCDLPEEE